MRAKPGVHKKRKSVFCDEIRSHEDPMRNAQKVICYGNLTIYQVNQGNIINLCCTCRTPFGHQNQQIANAKRVGTMVELTRLFAFIPREKATTRAIFRSHKRQ